MSYEVIWSEKAEEQFNHLFDYLVDYWSIDVAIRFTNDVDDVIKILQTMPLAGKVSEQDSRIRMILITPKNAFYYLLEESTVYILTLVDTRQDPLNPKF
jgi:plasmid stabilization system protein ParE